MQIVRTHKFGAIYILEDPRHDQFSAKRVRYVGQTTRDNSARLREHINSKSASKCSNWCRGLLKKGLKPLQTYIQTFVNVTSAELDECEIFWIAQMRSFGFELLNATDGGAGIAGLPIDVELLRRKKVSDGRKSYLAHEVNRSELLNNIKRHYANNPDALESRNLKLRKLWENPMLRERSRNLANKQWQNDDHRAKMSGDNHHMRRNKFLLERYIGGNNANARAVVCIDLALYFACVSDAAVFAFGKKSSASSICAAINKTGRSKRAAGYSWRYATDAEKITGKVIDTTELSL